MKPIKICFVTREYAHELMGKTGGIGVFLKQFTEQLKQHQFEIVVFSFGAAPTRFDDDGIRIVKIKDLSHTIERIRAPFRRYKIPGYLHIKMGLEYVNRFYISMYLSLFVLKNKFDLIEFHDYGGDACYFLGSLPKIVRCHGSAVTLHEFMGYYKRTTDTVFEYKFFRRFYKHIIAVSKFSREMTEEAFHLKTPPQIIYNGVCIKKNELAKAYLDAPTEAFSIFYFGSIRERKGINIACETFNKVVLKFPDATFHVMGNNNNDHWNKVAVNLLSEVALKQTLYYGMVPNTDIENYLNRAHVVLFPSFGENFSVALLEVMALGKLVVTSNIPSFQEVIKHKENGFIAEEFADYYNWIETIFEQRINLEKISNKAVETIKNNFEIQNMIQQNINYYKSLL
ncbi:MAG: glycosyltransferase family 4 protein [Psychroserpens sp.]|uniref:glycosyltransferase family 4 protein n=1 Tax=Psychroserpens sp. TaxID=2020870 RepID=UPI00300256ED